MDPILLRLANSLTIIPDAEAKAGLLGALAPSRLTAPTRLAFVNAHAANLCHRDAAFSADLLACEIILRDGTGMKILYKMLGQDPGLNLNGTDFIPELVDDYHGHPIALMGTADPHLSKAADILETKGASIVARIDGFQDDETYLSLAKQARPVLIILAMGMPKQERIAAYLAANLGYPCLIVCGGAVLDFIGGKVARAPSIFRKTGFEWFFRLIVEPKRLFNRYVIGNALFLGRSLCVTLKRKG